MTRSASAAAPRPSSSASRSTSSRGGCPRAWTTTRSHPRARAAGALAITDPKQVGRLMGDLMKTHKGQIEAGDVKRIAEELLAAK